MRWFASTMAAVVALAAGCTCSESSKHGASDASTVQPGQQPKLHNPCVEEYLVGTDRTCARLKDGSYRCRGWNRDKQLTHGNWPGLPKPTEHVVAFPGPWDQIVMRSDHTLARRDGEVWAWGNNWKGELVNGGPENIDVPTRVTTLPGRSKKIGGESLLCSLTVDDELWCQRNSHEVTRYTNVPAGVRGFIAGIPTGVCAYSASAVHCYSSPSHPIFADPETKELVPLAGLPPDDPIEELIYPCLRTRSGAVWCWGYAPGTGIFPPGTEERCRDGCPDIDFWRPRRVTALPAIADLGLMAAISREGHVYLWSGGALRLYDVPDLEPDQPVLLKDFYDDNLVLVSDGASHICTLKRSGKLYCMGENRHRQIRDEYCRNDLCPPTEVVFNCD